MTAPDSPATSTPASGSATAAPGRPAPAPLVRRIDHAAIERAAVARKRRARLASAPAVTLIVFGVLAAIAHWIPELGWTLLVPDLVAQIAPAVSQPVFTGGEPLLEGLPDAGAWPTLLLAASVVLGFASRQGALWRHLVAPAAAVTAVAAVPVGIPLLADPLTHALSLLAAIEAAVVGVVVAVMAARAYGRRGPHPFARRVPHLSGWRTAWLWLYLLAAPWPFVVGRALVGAEWRDRSAEIAGSGSSAFFTPLFSWALPLCWALGAAIGIAVWAALRWVPPASETVPAQSQLVPHAQADTLVGTVSVRPARVAPSVFAVIAIVLAVAVAAPLASTEAAATVETTRSEIPFQSDASCPVFELPGTEPPRALVPGTNCVGIESYAGYERTGRSAARDELDAAAGGATTDGTPISSRVVAAVYDPVLVIAGSTTGGPLDVVTAYSFDDASTVWWFQCPDAGPLSVRLAGTGPDEPGAARVTHPGEGEGVFVGCLDGGVRALDPRTGAAM